ncbi:MAG TPA: S-layer homology domain-containing protein [Opitutaceae bacterium]|nr:S-layer homology domain-containing protein [Opitutaceae bacterium]
MLTAFTDVDSSDKLKEYIDTAFEYKIIYGHKNGKFGSMEILTREQAMSMIARAMRITGLRMSSEDMNSINILSEYKEVGEITSWAKESVAVCVDSGIVTGRGDKRLAPKDDITRAEVAAIVRRLLQKSNLY